MYKQSVFIVLKTKMNLALNFTQNLNKNYLNFAMSAWLVQIEL